MMLADDMRDRILSIRYVVIVAYVVRNYCFILSLRFSNSFIKGACHDGRMIGFVYMGAAVGTRGEAASNMRIRASNSARRSSSDDQ